jgi:DNA-binding NarL/FixJ family response regulator
MTASPIHPGEQPVTVLIADDSAVVRRGIRSILDMAPEVRVVGEAWDGEQAVELARALLPDVVLLDVRMPRRDGVSAAREIAARSQVLMTTFTDDHDVIREALAAGAAGYLVHGAFAPEDLVASVLAVFRGSGVFSQEALAAIRSRPPAAQPAPSSLPADRFGLSERQVEVMELVARGLTNGEIAKHYFLAEKTVKNHINRIFAAMAVRNRAEAVAIWLGSGPDGLSSTGGH